MNCRGDFFTVDRIRLYRCLACGETCAADSIQNGEDCPLCNRSIDAKDHGKVEVRKSQLIEARVPMFGWIDVFKLPLPEAEKP